MPMLSNFLIAAAASSAAAAGRGAPLNYPTNIPGLQMWFDASDLSTLTEDTGNVTVWADKTINGNDFIGGSSTGPESGLSTRNGRNVLEFNGSNQIMTLNQGSGTTVVASPQTVSMFIKLDSNTTDAHLADGTSGTTRLLISGDSNWRMGVSSPNVDSGVAADTDWHVLTTIFDGASSSIRLDGTEIGTGSTLANDLRGHWQIGRGSSTVETNCRFAEIVVYDTALGASDLLSIETYMTTKWHPVLYESFNTADSTTIGPNHTWTETSGNLQILSNRVNSSTDHGEGRMETDIGSVNHFVEATIYKNGAPSSTLHSVRLMARFSDSARTYYAITLSGDNSYELHYRVAASATSLDTGTQAWSDGDTLRLEVIGSSIKAYINGVLFSEATDTTITTGQRAGVLVNLDTVDIDDLYAGPL